MTITVKDLIEELSMLDSNMEVRVASNYGDMGGTAQVCGVEAIIQSKLNADSGYSNSGKCLPDSDDDNEDSHIEMTDDEYVVLVGSDVDLDDRYESLYRCW